LQQQDNETLRRVWQAELAILSLQKKTIYEINTSW